MIVPQSAPKVAVSEPTSTPEVLPPAYELHSGVPSRANATNHLYLTRRLGEVKGTFVLDPELQIPWVIQGRTQTKKHLSLSALLGEVMAEVYVIGSNPPYSGKTQVEAYSTLGTVCLTLHAPSPRAPLKITASARLGEVKLLLPRSFRGPLQMSATLGEVQLSPALHSATVTHGDGRLFVGSWTEGEAKATVWAGDEAIVDAALGSIYVGYDDEPGKAH